MLYAHVNVISFGCQRRMILGFAAHSAQSPEVRKRSHSPPGLSLEASLQTWLVWLKEVSRLHPLTDR
jgi:hypothetical protein